MRQLFTVIRGRRVGDWIPFHCGDLVCEYSDERHVGRIDAIISGSLAKVTWIETNWISFVPIEKLRRFS